MISYETAVKLKEAGFPLQIVGEWEWFKEQLLKTTLYHKEQFYEIEGNGYAVPNLSELIEACGYKLAVLRNHANYDNESKEWTASTDWYEDSSQSYGGASPEEAVAQLWLAINKK